MIVSLAFRWAGGLLLATVVALGAAALWWRYLLWTPTGSPEITIEVEMGAASTTVLHQLADAELLPSVLAGRLYLESLARGRTIQWGTYLIPARSRPADVLERLLQGRVKLLNLTVIEGMNSADIQGVLDEAGIADSQNWSSVIANTGLVADLAPDAQSLEGFLFPETYTFSTSVDPSTIARTMINRFRTVWAEELAAGHTTSLTVSDIVTLASLVEAETGVPEERRRVAGVFVNRLQRGMLLQCDPTVVYALQRRGEWTGRYDVHQGAGVITHHGS